ncbi:MAG: rRNA ((1402)-N(4))-methyltransferase RsmH [Candidatus Saccharibacteria bacterium]|nr:rRNA ((1402)-N(4))-methyltransferase RsmH [Candidatus Saccharibacteria bacterium]
MTDDSYQIHTPVLLAEVLSCLQPQAGENYLDATAGYGGHADSILTQTGNYADSVVVDRDARAITTLETRFKDVGLAIRHEDYYAAASHLVEEGRQFDMILADIGVSSLHLDEAVRGFSFANDGPLDMRMDQRVATTAAHLVNSASEDELINILARYGEEPKAAKVARLIIAARPLQTTAELATVVKKAWPGHSRVHPATRTFQALRIAVNDELGQLERSLPLWHKLLKPGGRLAVISFHSLEDRVVKQFFAEQGGDFFDASLKILTKRPLTASATEIVSNPRSRSAKLRAAVKIKTK